LTEEIFENLVARSAEEKGLLGRQRFLMTYRNCVKFYSKFFEHFAFLIPINSRKRKLRNARTHTYMSNAIIRVVTSGRGGEEVSSMWA